MIVEFYKDKSEIHYKILERLPKYLKISFLISQSSFSANILF